MLYDFPHFCYKYIYWILQDCMSLLQLLCLESTLYSLSVKGPTHIAGPILRNFQYCAFIIIFFIGNFVVAISANPCEPQVS